MISLFQGFDKKHWGKMKSQKTWKHLMVNLVRWFKSQEKCEVQILILDMNRWRCSRNSNGWYFIPDDFFIWIMFFKWRDMCSKETKGSNFQTHEDSNNYEFYATGGVLKTTQGKIILRIGRNMMILPLGCLNG